MVENGKCKLKRTPIPIGKKWKVAVLPPLSPRKFFVRGFLRARAMGEALGNRGESGGGCGKDCQYSEQKRRNYFKNGGENEIRGGNWWI